MYFDHITLNRESNGEFILVDKNSDPVVIAGYAGKGRVVFDGTIVYQTSIGTGLQEGEAEKAVGVNRDLLINSVYWFTGREKEATVVEICDRKKEDITTTEADSTFVSFTMRILTARPLANVKAKAFFFDSSGNRFMQSDLAGLPGTIDGFWQSPVKLKVNLMGEYKEVRMEVELADGQGGKVLKTVLF